MLRQLLSQRALHQPPRQPAQHPVRAQDLLLAALAGDQPIDQPIGQHLARLLIDALAATLTNLAQQLGGQPLALLLVQPSERLGQPRVADGLLDQLVAELRTAR